jgi:hypothetical protein
MLPEVLDMVKKAGGITLLLATVSFVTAFLVRTYMMFVVLPKKEIGMEVSPDQKHWVKYVAPFQDMELKGLLALTIVVMIISYLIRQVAAGLGLITILVGLSFFTFTIGLIRPTYYLTTEGLMVLNWYPPYMNRNMGFYRWSLFDKFGRNENEILVAGKKIIPILANDAQIEEVHRYVRRMINRQLATAKEEESGKAR